MSYCSLLNQNHFIYFINCTNFFLLSNQNTDWKKIQTYVALGDSYTIGESFEEALQWPNQLITAVNVEENRIESPIIIAQTE